VTREATGPGVVDGVARVTRTASKRGFVSVRRYCTGSMGRSRSYSESLKLWTLAAVRAKAADDEEVEADDWDRKLRESLGMWF